VTEEQGQEQQGHQYPLQQQQEQYVIGAKVNPEFRRELFLKDAAAGDAADVRKRAKDLQGRKLGYVVRVEKRVQLAGDPIVVLNLDGFYNLADARGKVISTLTGIKEGREPAGDAAYLLFNRYSTVVPLVSAGGGAGGKTLVVDVGPDMGRLTGEKDVPAMVVLLHSFYLDKGNFDALVEGTIFQELFASYPPELVLGIAEPVAEPMVGTSESSAMGEIQGETSSAVMASAFRSRVAW